MVETPLSIGNGVSVMRDMLYKGKRKVEISQTYSKLMTRHFRKENVTARVMKRPIIVANVAVLIVMALVIIIAPNVAVLTVMEHVTLILERMMVITMKSIKQKRVI